VSPTGVEAPPSTARIEGLPPGPRAPKLLQSVVGALGALYFDERVLGLGRRQYGDLFTVRIFGFGNAVIVADPALIKQVFAGDPETLHAGEQSPLRAVLGPNSLLAIDEEEHTRQRKLLMPPFHGERMRDYEGIIEEEALREIESWPEGESFRTLEPMMRITLNSILRSVFGAEGTRLATLQEVMPRMVKLGSRLVGMPFLHRDLGPRSPWGRFQRMRKQCEDEVGQLIDETRRDPRLAERSDVLALLVQATHEDGSPMTDPEIFDQLGTLLVAGHETTATTMAWAVERLRRHPELLRRLVDEADEGGGELREATIREVQRTRPVIFGTGRYTMKPFELGDYVIPPGTFLMLAGITMHHDPRLFPNPRAFEPDRFLGQRPDANAWIPFGGGRRRCIGAAFAQMEMDIVLRTMLQRLELVPTTERRERWRFRGVAYAPAKGGLAEVRRRGKVAPADETQAPEAIAA